MRNGDSDTDASPLVIPKVSSRPPRSSDSKAASIALGAPVASTATAKVWLSSASATLAAPTALAASRRNALRSTTGREGWRAGASAPLAAPTALAASRRNALRSTTVSEGGCSVEQLQQEQAQRRRRGCSFGDPPARARIEQVHTRGVDLDLDGLARARVLAAGPDDDGGASVLGPVPVDVEVTAEVLHEVDQHVEVAFADGQVLGPDPDDELAVALRRAHDRVRRPHARSGHADAVGRERAVQVVHRRGADEPGYEDVRGVVVEVGG